MKTNDFEPSLKIINNSHYSYGFPNKDWKKLISRDNFVAQLDDPSDKSLEVIFIEGDEDTGKTTLCAQFALKNSETTISVFFNPNNNLDYSVEYYCTNVVHQIQHMLNETINEGDQNPINIEEYQRQIFQLRKKIKNKKINLVVDGLEEKVKSDPDFVRRIFDILPIGYDIFKVFITGNRLDYFTLSPKLKKNQSKSVGMSGFTQSEIRDYLGLEDNYSSSQITNLYVITKGYPGRLKTLKRLLKDDQYSLDDISQTTTYNSWVEIDCESIEISIPVNNAIISLLALNDQSFTVEDISQICSQSLEECKKILGSLHVLHFVGKDVGFVSNAHRKYFANKLRSNKNQVQQLLIEYYASSNNINHIIELPKLHAEKKEWEKIINILDDEFLPKIIDSTGSLKIVNESLELGVKASEKQSRYPDLWRYSIQGSIVNELDNYLFWESEIKARIAIKDFAGAISLAESAVLRIDRLRLLALVAKRQKQLNNDVDEDLIKLIQDLYVATDLFSVGDKIYDIVADLIYAIPNLAIEIIEKSSGNVSDTSINDWIIAKLSIAAVDSSIKEKNNEDSSKKLKAIQALNNPSVRKINTAISFLVGNYTSDKVIEEVNKLTDSKEKLRLLRLWLSNNKLEDNDAAKVIEMALNELVISSSKTSITLDILKELSSQLPFVKDPGVKRKLLERFRKIESGLSDLGLTKNKYIYKLNIFHTEIALSEDKSIHSINTIIKEVDSIPDILVRLESYCEVYVKINSIRQSEELKKKSGFVYSRIISLSKELYSKTASHYSISKYFLHTIGKRNPKIALSICKEINTVSRRVSGKLHVLEAYLENNIKYISFDVIKEIENSLEYDWAKYILYSKVLERYSESKKLHFNIIKNLIYFGNKSKDSRSASDKVSNAVLFYKIIAKNSEWKIRLESSLQQFIYKSWEAIEADWERIDVGFTICAELSNINEKFSKRIFDETIKIKSESWIDSQPVATTYLLSVGLISQAYIGLLASKNERSEDYKIIESLIARIPSNIEKVKIWTELGLQAHLNNRDDIAKNITEQHVIVIIQDLLDKQVEISQILDSLTLIHLFNTELANEFIDQLPKDYKDTVLSGISNFYITRRNPFEPYDDDNKYSSSYSDLVKAIHIISNINTDSDIYYQLSNVQKAITQNKLATFSKTQIIDIADRLSKIVAEKLPDINNIRHDGYIILSKTIISKLRKDSSVNSDFWLALIKEAEDIPNLSDKVFVISILLEEIPFEKISGGVDVKTKLFEQVISIIENFSPHYELVNRVNDISKVMYAINRTKWKEVVNRAFNVSLQLEHSGESYSSQRSIIDSMYRIDPNYAKELIKLVDKNSPENNIGKLLHDHFDSLEIETKIKNDKSLDQKEKENYRKVVRGVLAALRALNSDKISTKKINEVANYLPIGNKLPLHEVFPIFVFYLKNCTNKYKDVKAQQSSVSTIHRDNFKEAVKASNLIEILSHKRKSTERSYKKFFIDEDFNTNKAVSPNSREEALTFIKNWMEDVAEDFIIVADPYFQKEDIEILKIIKEIKKDLDINIVGSVNWEVSNENDFQAHWKKLSDEVIPFTNVTFCWIPGQNDQIPFHDRWILTKDSGMRLGTSFNSIGKNKESELSIMNPNEALKIKEQLLLDYVEKRKREHNNQRVKYKSFSL